MIIESIAKYLTGRRHIHSIIRVGDNLEITFDNKTKFVGLHVCAVYPKTVDYDVYWGYPTHTLVGRDYFDLHNDPPTEEQLREFYLHAMRVAHIDFHMDE